MPANVRRDKRLGIGMTDIDGRPKQPVPTVKFRAAPPESSQLPIVSYAINYTLSQRVCLSNAVIE
jgi:hypothetical protein